MRRKDREMASACDAVKTVRENKVCRLGLSQNGMPYIVPLNYGFEYEGGALALFFHGAKEGKKIDIMKENPSACFEIDCEGGLVEGDEPCKYSYSYKSVVGFGKVFFLHDPGEKKRALDEIMNHQSGKNESRDYPAAALERTAVFKMQVEEFTGKERAP